MRPKSMATVVVVLRSVTPPASSTPTECSVIAASVLSGSMSELDPMNVVLPTANPPATTILTTGGAAAPPAADEALAAVSEGGYAIENTLQQAQGQGGDLPGVRAYRGGAVDTDDAVVGEVRDDHADDSQRESQQRGQLRDRHVGVPGVLEDRT